MRTPHVLSGIALAGALLPAAESERPNILWLTSEDNNTFWIGCYGNPDAETPNIDRLASEGFRYVNAFANAPVCAPSRSTWITGVYALSMGTHPMRSRYDIPHDRIPYYPDCLRADGYYCANFTKTDYNIGGRPDGDCWDATRPLNWKKKRKKAPYSQPDWDVLKQHEPFFQVVNFFDSHESRAQGDVENTDHRPADTRLRAYHPDLPDIRKNYAKYYDAMKRMDGHVGRVLARLDESGMADNTIVVYCSDHGGVMPRSKRFLFDTGLHAPLIVRIPEKYRSLWPADRPGSTVDRLVSFVDMPKTWLSLAGAEIPSVMQGRIFLGPDAEPEPEYHFAFRGRMDERIDNTRAVHDKRFLYIKNYMPFVPSGQHLDFLWKMAATRAWDAYDRSGGTDAVTGRFFRPKAGPEELYDSVNDPDNVHNLIGDPEYADVADRMQKALHSWQLSIHDAGLIPESDGVRRAADHGVTLYELVRNPEWYNLPASLDAADTALDADPAKLPQLTVYMKSADAGLRYWGVTGCLMLGAQAAPAEDAVRALLSDDSHEVRAMAAWVLFRLGDRDACCATLGALLENHSYATLSVLNIIDWMGDDGAALLPLVRKIRNETEVAYVRLVCSDILVQHGPSTDLQ
ncbi:MAG: sulfatase-like hydrolase/transferase [Kiritimatiellales bacterium]